MAEFGKPKLTEEEKKAREEEAEQKKKEKEKIKQEQAFNKQVNFFIMRYMWQVIRKRSADDSIYLTFHISRTRYAHVIDYGKGGFKKNEIDFIKTETGIPEDILTGKQRFICMDKKGNEIITLQDWKKLFELRKDRKKLGSEIKEADGDIEELEKKYETANDKYKEQECFIEDKLKRASRTGEAPFQRLCSFFKNGYGSKVGQLKEISRALAHIKFTLLDECTAQELKGLCEELSKRRELVKSIYQYREARGDFIKN